MPSSSAVLRPPSLRKISVRLAAVRADEVAHVLDDAEHRHVDLAEHRQPLAGVDQRHVLRRRDDHRAGERDALRQRQLRVAGARRQVDDQVVERAPFDVAEELLERLHHHRPAPDHRRVGLHDEAERHQLHAVLLQRQDAVADHPRLGDAEHHRHRGAVDVGVEQADAMAELRQRQREVGGDGRLADAALAAGDRHHVADLGDQVGILGDRLLRRLLAGGGLGHVHVDLRLRHAGEGADDPLHLVAHLLAGRRIVGGHLEVHHHRAGIRLDLVYEAEGDDVPAHAWELHRLQGVPHRGFEIV